MAKFEVELPIERWQTGEFLPKEMSGPHTVKVISVKKNETKKTASARVTIDGDKTIYTIEYSSLNPKTVGNKAVLAKEEYSVILDAGRIISAK